MDNAERTWLRRTYLRRAAGWGTVWLAMHACALHWPHFPRWLEIPPAVGALGYAALYWYESGR